MNHCMRNVLIDSYNARKLIIEATDNNLKARMKDGIWKADKMLNAAR